MKKVLAVLLILTSFASFGGIASNAWTSPDEKIYFDDKCKNFEDCLLHSDIGYWNKILRWIGVKYDVDEALENAKDPFGSEWVEEFETENSEEEKLEIFNTALRVIAPEGSEKFFNTVKKLRKCEPAANENNEFHNDKEIENRYDKKPTIFNKIFNFFFKTSKFLLSTYISWFVVDYILGRGALVEAINIVDGAQVEANNIIYGAQVEANNINEIAQNILETAQEAADQIIGRAQAEANFIRERAQRPEVTNNIFERFLERLRREG